MMKKFFAVGLCAGFLLTSSCLKKQNLDDDNLGEPIAPLEMTKAIGTGYGSYDYNEMKAGEFTNFREWNRLQDSVVQNVRQQGIELTRAVNTVDSLTMDLLVQTELFSSSGQTAQSTTRQYLNAVISKSDGLAVQSTDTLATQGAGALSIQNKKDVKSDDYDPTEPTLMFLDFASYAFGICHDSGSRPETCHNLSVTEIQYPVPIAAISQHNCPDANNCTIAAKRIEFDRVLKTVLTDEGKPTRIHYSLVLSPNVPFMSRILESCSRAVYTLSSNGQKLLADMCKTVNNYRFAP